MAAVLCVRTFEGPQISLIDPGTPRIQHCLRMYNDHYGHGAPRYESISATCALTLSDDDAFSVHAIGEYEVTAYVWDSSRLNACITLFRPHGYSRPSCANTHIGIINAISAAPGSPGKYECPIAREDCPPEISSNRQTA